MTDRGKLPTLSMEAMTPKIFDADKAFEPAMSYPLPSNPDARLLREARRQVLAYLGWITSDNGVNSEGPDWSVHEIRRACNRLVEITDALPEAVDAEVEARFMAAHGRTGEGNPEIPYGLRKSGPKGDEFGR